MSSFLQWADLCNAFLQEAEWLYNKSTPTFDDYFGNAWKSSSGPLQLVFAYFAVVQNIKKEEIENLQKYHDIISRPSHIFRLCNDLASASVSSSYAYMYRPVAIRSRILTFPFAYPG